MPDRLVCVNYFCENRCVRLLTIIGNCYMYISDFLTLPNSVNVLECVNFFYGGQYEKLARGIRGSQYILSNTFTLLLTLLCIS